MSSNMVLFSQDIAINIKSNNLPYSNYVAEEYL